MEPNCKGRSSYTDLNFSQTERNRRKFNDLMKNAKNTKIIVVLDWLSVLFNIPENIIPEPETESENFSFEAGELTLIYTGHGQQHYKYIWHIHYQGEHLGQLLSHTRNEKFVRKGTVKVEFRNHLFYSSQLWPFYNYLVSALSLSYKNISRVDIAIDGMNYLLNFMNLYVKQEAESKAVEFKGKPRINSKVLHKPSMLYQNFMIGTPGAGKTITIYNKSLDIVNTRKEYIQEYWKANGILKNSLPIPSQKDKLGKDIERTYLEGYENIFRFEIRLKGDKIKEIENFDLSLLKTPDGLISIVKLMTRQYFDAFFVDNPNTARCTPIDLIPFENFNLIPLEKVELKERGDIYKTRLSIHKNVKQLYTQHITPDNASAREMILFDINLYDLQKWFKRKYLNEWQPAYSKFNTDKQYTQQVDEFFTDILAEIETDE